VLIAGSSAVSAANAPSLGLTAFGSIAVDDTNGHVFVSGPNENEVLVFDFDGNLVRTIPNIAGAAAMVVQASSLYVVAGEAGSIERIDLGTLADAGTVATGLSTPQSLAFAGGKLWTGVNGNGQWSQLASITLAGAVTVFPSPMYYAPDFATTPADPNTLYLAQDGLSPGSLYRLDVAGGAPVVNASNINTNGSNIQQLAVSPDGTRVIPASGAPYNFQEFAASTLTADGIVYPAQPYPSAVAVSPGAGGRLATGLNHGYSMPDISVFKLGSPQAIFTATTNNSNGTANVVPHGLALSSDGLRLFAVTADDLSSALRLWVFNLNAAPTATSVRVTPSPSGYGQGITATATVAPTDGGGTVSFSANNTPIPGCSAQQLTKTPNGLTATCMTSALPVGQDVVTASYGGDTQYLPSQGSATTTVNRGTTTMTASPAQLVKGKSGTLTATFRATLAAYGGPLSSRTIVFSSAGTELCAGATSASGFASCTITVSNNASRSLTKNGYTAAFGGDNQYLPSSADATVSG